jgi:hypothetical protein
MNILISAIQTFLGDSAQHEFCSRPHRQTRQTESNPISSMVLTIKILLKWLLIYSKYYTNYDKQVFWHIISCQLVNSFCSACCMNLHAPSLQRSWRWMHRRLLLYWHILVVTSNKIRTVPRFCQFNWKILYMKSRKYLSWKTSPYLC